MAVGSFFLSAAPTAQNSPELHFRFINYFIQSSLLRSLLLPVLYYSEIYWHRANTLQFWINMNLQGFSNLQKRGKCLIQTKLN